MALISCPECGKQKVSNTAESCPECGFAIKKYYQKIKEDEMLNKEENEIERRKCERFQEFSDELNQKLKQIDDEPYPDKPKFLKLLFDASQGGRLTYGFLAIMIISFFIGVLTNNIIFLAIFVLSLIIGLPFLLYLTYSDYTMFLDIYHKETKDWENLKKERKKKLIEYYKNKDEIDAWYENDRLNAEREKIKNTLRCPICHCTKVKKISTANRVASVTALGLASSKIGKQYECEVCHHKW